MKTKRNKKKEGNRKKKQSAMRNITRKFLTLRKARARGTLHIAETVAQRVEEKQFPKGDPFSVAKVAAIAAAKRTDMLIPYCHPIPLEGIEVRFSQEGVRLVVEVEVEAIARTGVEMEALTAVSVGLLTLYDMLKPLKEEMQIEEITLVEKRGGESTYREAPPQEMEAAVLVFSDSVFSGEKEDRAGIAAKELLEEAGVRVKHYEILPDEKEKIVAAVCRLADEERVGLVVTSGGTGASPRDVTYEALVPLLHKRMTGVEEAVRAYGMERTPYAALSRTVAGFRNDALILALPGSRRGIKESLEFLLPWVFHIFRPFKMKRHD